MKLNELRSGAAGVQELVDAMHQQHRTTQALVAETLLRSLRRWANECIADQRVDARNHRTEPTGPPPRNSSTQGQVTAG